MGFLAALGRVNAAHPWSHNDAYVRFVLRHARAVRRHGGDTAVDVGCGTGNLLRRLSEVFPKTIGIEPDADTAAIAELRFRGSTVDLCNLCANLAIDFEGARLGNMSSARAEQHAEREGTQAPERTARGRPVMTAGLIFSVLAVLLLFYAAHVGLLFMGATEGDTPAATSVGLPDEAQILSEEKSCSSGGCTLVLQVAPPHGQSPAELATAMGATPQLQISGNLLDPRTISVRAVPREDSLELRADYFSQTYVP
ncbi:hypothetical protein K0817_010440 [Microbacterium sp. HD4P20]|uniref:hypothetical protein n=1 Tax=Microbacterium sp. HD4P20 TaxID=2864874 RepID=UPI001C63CAF5|nr:hypothetical protein [Microbacterium sp. HD4P20]MCP2636974.1 hypothetical protein [Microbacterium sp. HD4P20]